MIFFTTGNQWKIVCDFSNNLNFKAGNVPNKKEGIAFIRLVCYSQFFKDNIGHELALA